MKPSRISGASAILLGVALLLCLVGGGVLGLRAWAQKPASSVKDPIDYDPATGFVNSPVNIVLKLDLDVADPDGRPVRDVDYQIEFTVPGRYAEEVGANGTSSDGRIQVTQK
jgi:hypothetical protein